MSWLDREFELPVAPWHRPRERYGVTITYGSHVLAALIHWPFARLARLFRASGEDKETP